MEKFSKWRDPATGIAPFLPAASPYSPKSGAVVSAELVVALAIRVVKLPLALVALVLHLLATFTPLHRYTLRLLLFISGVYKISVLQDRKENKQPRAGDVVVTNHTSPLDAWIFSCVYHCVHVVPCRGKFARVSAFSVMLNAVSLDENGLEEELEKIVKQAKASGKVVVLYGEGTTSNGRALLPIEPIPASTIESTFFPVAMKYTQAAAITSMPSSLLIWGWKLLGLISGVSATVKLGTRVSGPGADDAVTNEIAEQISRAGRLRRVGNYLNLEAKREFVESWNKYHK